MALNKYVIERDIPEVGSVEREELRAAAGRANEVLRDLGPDIQWVQTYVSENKTYCVYLAKDEAIIRRQAELLGLPVTKISMIRKIIDPTTEKRG